MLYYKPLQRSTGNPKPNSDQITITTLPNPQKMISKPQQVHVKSALLVVPCGYMT